MSRQGAEARPASAAAAAILRGARPGNGTAALGALHAARRLSRADLARALRLNRSSAGHIIADLLAHGLVREVEGSVGEVAGARARRAGRPGILLELIPEAVAFIGVEIGVEHISAVEIDLTASVVRHASEPFDGPGTPPGRAVAVALDLAFGVMPSGQRVLCAGLGVATPSQMGRDGVVREAPLLGWRDLDLAAMVRAALPATPVPAGLPMMVENDANALAIGAAYGRPEARTGVTLVLNLETGVGGGILIDGRLFRGGRGLAGEIGHLRLAATGPDAAVPLEARLGLAGVLAQVRAQGGHATSGEAPLEAFLRGVRDREPGAVGLAEGWARALAFAVTQASRVIDPDTVVLGGSLSALHPLLAARVEAHRRDLQEPGFPMPPILVAAEGAAFGAACMMHQRFLSPEDRGGMG